MKAGLAYLLDWGTTNLKKYVLTKNGTPGMEY
jgi:2-keto-3-deoxy-galactonokinase